MRSAAFDISRMFSTQLVLLILFSFIGSESADEPVDFNGICQFQLEFLLMLSEEEIWGNELSVKKKLDELFNENKKIDYNELTEQVMDGYEKLVENIRKPEEMFEIFQKHEEKLRKADFIYFHLPFVSAENVLNDWSNASEVPSFLVQFLWEMASNIHIRFQSLPNESSSDRIVLNQIQHWLVRHLISKFEEKMMADGKRQKNKSVFVAMRKIFNSIIDEEDDEQLFKVGYAFRPYDTEKNNMQTEAMVEEMADLIYRNVEKKKLDTETIKSQIEKAIENWQWAEAEGNNYEKRFVNILEEAFNNSEDVKLKTKSYHFLQELFLLLKKKVYKLHWLPALAGQMSALEKNGGHFDESTEIERMVQLHVMAAMAPSIPIIQLIEDPTNMLNDDDASLWTLAAKDELTTVNDDHSGHGQSAMSKVQDMIVEYVWDIINVDCMEISQTFVRVNNEFEKRSGFFKYQGLTSSINREELAKQMEWLFGELKKAVNGYEIKIRQKVEEGHLKQLKKVMIYYAWFQELKKAVKGMDGQKYIRHQQKQNMVKWLDGMLARFEKMPEDVRNIAKFEEEKSDLNYLLFKEILSEMFAKIFHNVWFKEEIKPKMFAKTKNQNVKRRSKISEIIHQIKRLSWEKEKLKIQLMQELVAKKLRTGRVRIRKNNRKMENSITTEEKDEEKKQV